MSAGSRLRIIVLGYVVRGPLGGLAWHHLQYALGLARLGHDVVFLEESGDYDSCYNPRTDEWSTDPEYGLAFAAEVFSRVGLGDRWAYFDAHRDEWFGPAAPRVSEICATADLCLNVSGLNRLDPWWSEVEVRALIDTDPVFTQVKHLNDADAQTAAAAHTAFFTFGENLPAGRSTIPDDGFAWQPTRQPIVLDQWPRAAGAPDGRFTTVMLWESYGRITYGGRVFGLKAESFTPYLDFPRHAAADFELAVGSPSAPGEYLASEGWHVVDPRIPTATPWAYREYVRRSKAEFAVAKDAYVATNSGWFSERSACYLASGRPVVVQDTGFSDWLAVGDGVLSFRSPEEAAAAVADVNARYDHHCAWARRVAEEVFDSARVLGSLLERAMASPAMEVGR